ncbi:hypothetical protein [Lentzea kentuckyensis]|uniref:hypothetical protein n=1 Tax=Lentzea kentuckyensis TaxID=360086 RepID=UPI00117B62F2|nr:hypothetical protein [Lentzea kentuckyensis]
MHEDTAVIRVLWMLAQGMVWPWLLEGMCDRTAVEHAVRQRFADPPIGDHLGFHLTDLGRARLVDWYQHNAPLRTDPAHADDWRAVTLR